MNQMKFSIKHLSILFLTIFTTSANAVLFPVEVGQEWIYSEWDSDGNTGISSFNFTTTKTVALVDYVVSDDGWAINSTDSSVTGYDDINTLSDPFEFILTPSTPVESITTSLGFFDTAYVFHTKDSFHEVWDYFVQDIGYIFVKENWFDVSGNVVLTEYAELIEVKSVPEPGSILLIALGMMGLGFARHRRRA